MGTKIYDGFRFRAADLWEVHERLMGFRPTAHARMRDAVCRFLAGYAAERADRAAINGEACPAPLSGGMRTLRERQREIRATGSRDPEVDVDFTVAVLPYRGEVYGLLFCEHADWKWDFLRQPWIEVFAYWNNGDRPDDVSDDEWRMRGETWSALLGQDAWDRPVGSCLTFDFSRPDIPAKHEEIAAHCSSVEQRATAHAWDRASGAWIATRQRERASPLPATDWSDFWASRDWLKTEEGIAATATEYARIAPLLPVLTAEYLRGEPDPFPPSTEREEP